MVEQSEIDHYSEFSNNKFVTGYHIYCKMFLFKILFIGYFLSFSSSNYLDSDTNSQLNSMTQDSHGPLLFTVWLVATQSNPSEITWPMSGSGHVIDKGCVSLGMTGFFKSSIPWQVEKERLSWVSVSKRELIFIESIKE